MRTIATEGLPARQRVALIRDSAAQLFNLEVDLSGATGRAHARIQVKPAHAGAAVVDVNTSHSLVYRDAARARRAASGNLLIYLIRQRGSIFENSRGGQFTTEQGSIVIGTPESVYRAVAAPGADWSFRVLSVPERLFPLSRGRIRASGYELLAPRTPFGTVLRGFIETLVPTLPLLDAGSSQASFGALDQLVSAAFGKEPEDRTVVMDSVDAHRRRMALAYIERELGSPELAPQAVADAMRISVRQLHRAFEASSSTVTAEIRRLRIERATRMIQAQPGTPVTDVAMACGFGSLASFYRLFKASAGMTASDWRLNRRRESSASCP